MVFMTQFGTIPTSNAVNKMLRQLLDKLGIHRENFHFHSLRHSHVALLLAKGVDIYPISKRLGHSDIRTTMNTYAYLIDEYKGKTDDKIVNALNQLQFGTLVYQRCTDFVLFYIFSYFSKILKNPTIIDITTIVEFLCFIIFS